ncbi:hypothetical protein [Aurantimonas sp. VKM B-3413]|uniref:hypothetical protein n=1 Tax=Aurantimonas sp. VKM B-3413 TaxID=2779401 RepID=UPI001E5FB4F3|nr:hypothetical protein [Aurantimonas sp. VKM B-3413]MCB8838238.1 hypothetical protein [Aurantimonas sp. VKM B-3413]
MAAKPVLLDTNLAVLLVVGLFGTDLIARHKKLRAYDQRDFEILQELVSPASELIFTPHILTEMSNLLRQIGDPLRSRLTELFSRFILTATEQSIESKTAVRRAEFTRLGLPDSVSLCLAETGAVLLTDDLDLYLAAEHAGFEAINFAHVQAARPGFR